MTMIELRMDSELRKLILALTKEEYRKLEQSIKVEGCRDALVVWGTTIVDGHNRYNICVKNNIEFKTISKEFESKEQAKLWMLINQLGRRNLTPEKFKYFIGKLYNESKKEHGGDRSSPQNGDLKKTSKKIAEEYKISKNTVERAANFAEAIDNIGEECGTEVKDKILNQEIDITQKDVIKVAKEEEKNEILAKIETGEADNVEDAKVKIIRGKSGKKIGVHFSSEDDEWYTPKSIIDRVLKVFGGEIDLDPCSNDKTEPNVPARRHFTILDDGLKKKWEGKVYVNPPYGLEDDFFNITIIPNADDRNSWNYILQHDCHIDITAICKKSNRLFGIDIKVEEKNPNNNFFIETWSNKQQGKFGWLFTSKADLIFYCFIEPKTSYLFSMKKLFKWALKENKIYDFDEVKQNKYGQLNDTWGRLVGIDTIKRHVGCKEYLIENNGKT